MNNTTQDCICAGHENNKCESHDWICTFHNKPQTSEGSWEKEFEKFFGSLENEMGGITNRVPINTSSGVADLGTMIFLDIQKQVKAFIRNLIAEEQKSLLERVSTEVIGEDMVRLSEKDINKTVIDNDYNISSLDVKMAELDEIRIRGILRTEQRKNLDQLKAHLTTGGGE